MRVKLRCLSFLFLCVTTFAFAKDAQVAMQNNSDLYWLSYENDGTFLMQIDSTGRVVRPPTLVSKVFGPTISLNGADKINLWGRKQRAVIDEKTLSVVKTVTTTIGSPTNYWGSRGPDSVTQKPEKNFAVIAEPYHFLKFFGVSPTGVQNGTTWKISSSYKELCAILSDCLPGMVSSDGKTVFWSEREFSTTSSYTNLYIQPLLDTGRPDFQKLFGREEELVVDADISNVLPGGQIYAIYVAGDFGPTRQLILQAVDAQTGQGIGDRVLLGKKRFGYYANAIAIDPLGRFVVYGYSNEQNVGFTSFLALDGTGHPAGAAKILVRKVFPFDIHLLKD